MHKSRWWELGKKFNSEEEQVAKNTEDQVSAGATGGSAVKDILALGCVQAQKANSGFLFFVCCIKLVTHLYVLRVH